ncbi:MAG: polysaccharide deacetylase family protein [Candidatus Solibacter sp.]
MISVAPDLFRRQMESLAESGVKVVPLEAIFDNPGAVAITFDDGFANVAAYATPVLERLGLPATIFVVSGYCGQHNNWPTQPAGIPQMPLMDWAGLRRLPSLFSFGAHTVNHPDLSTLSPAEVEREVKDSRAEIQHQTGRAVSTFAYPYGSMNATAAALVRREFSIGCGTRLDFVRADADRAALPRLDTFYLKSPGWFRHPFGSAYRSYIGLRRWMRESAAERIYSIGHRIRQSR